MVSLRRRFLVARRGFIRRGWGLVAIGVVGGLGSSRAITPVFAQDRLSLQSLETLLRSDKSRGLVILVRHAETVSGIGDPPGFRLEDCSTQRNLSAEGRAQARRMGEWFTSRGLVPTAVRSSQWCRCLDTAKEAFAKAVPITPWPALNSTFQGRGDAQAQKAQTQDYLRALLDPRASSAKPVVGEVATASVAEFEVWVTHQVLISALTGQYVSMGEMIVARPDRQGRLSVIGRLSSDFK